MDVCPKRVSNSNKTGVDKWIVTGEVSTCSFCEGLNPAIFLTMLRMDQGIVIPLMNNQETKIELDSGMVYSVYFDHFTKDQQDTFIEMINGDKIKFRCAYPGYFHVLPFFCMIGGEQL